MNIFLPFYYYYIIIFILLVLALFLAIKKKNSIYWIIFDNGFISVLITLIILFYAYDMATFNSNSSSFPEAFDKIFLVVEFIIIIVFIFSILKLIGYLVKNKQINLTFNNLEISKSNYIFLKIIIFLILISLFSIIILLEYEKDIKKSIKNNDISYYLKLNNKKH